MHPEDGPYSNVSENGPREIGNIKNPIYQNNGKESTDFSLASNIVDFGVRAYLIHNRSQGTGILQQIFPDLNETTDDFLIWQHLTRITKPIRKRDQTKDTHFLM